jgi:hypothetical protein
MKIAIMQPYFLPYIGYFQLINSVDKFIVYDNIKYTKKGWINRNRFLQNGKDVLFSVPLKKHSDYLDIKDRQISDGFNRVKLLNQLKGAYRRAPYFEQTFQLLERVVNCNEQCLFGFLHYSIVEICEHLGIQTEICVSSTIEADHDLKNQERVLDLCESVNATSYINAIGGVDLYSKDAFQDSGINLNFIQAHSFEYPQFGSEFVPWLSIIDVMMFNSLADIQSYINCNYQLV